MFSAPVSPVWSSVTLPAPGRVWGGADQIVLVLVTVMENVLRMVAAFCGSALEMSIAAKGGGVATARLRPETRYLAPMTPTIDPATLPPLALSVRQPWAWAIIHGGKVIENRTSGSIRSGNMTLGPVAIHAATGLKRDEYLWAEWKMAQSEIALPHPTRLVRGAIIGMVDVVDIIIESDSPWFGGRRPGGDANPDNADRPDVCGLVLENPRACAPVPARGALGYFRWERDETLEVPTPKWMETHGRASDAGDTGLLFDTLPPGYRTPPEKPFGRPRNRPTGGRS